MRIASYRHAGKESYGFVVGDRIIDRSQVPGVTAASVRELLVAGLPAASVLDGIEPSLNVSDVELLIPVEPSKILCAGVNFPTHRTETGQSTEKPATPMIFTRFADSFVGHGTDIRKPESSIEFDYECEPAIVIGKTAWNVTPDEALDYVAGYSCLNDGSVRDWQAHTRQWIPGKNWYKSGGIGPWIVTADEFGVPDQQLMQTRVNGEVRQSAKLGEMIHSVAELISYCSTFTPLYPGDIIAGGTTGGVAKFMDPPGFLKVGDVVEIEIEGIGILRNKVAKLDTDAI